jgi:ATP-dependent DNA ligase
VIGGITEPSGSRKYFVYDRGKLRYVGHTGTGFSNEMLKDILKRLTPHFTDSCPFDPRPKASARVQWVKPRLVWKKIADPSEIIKQNQAFKISTLLNQQQHPSIDR